MVGFNEKLMQCNPDDTTRQDPPVYAVGVCAKVVQVARGTTTGSPDFHFSVLVQVGGVGVDWCWNWMGVLNSTYGHFVAFMQGVARIRIEAMAAREPFYVARVSRLSDEGRLSDPAVKAYVDLGLRWGGGFGGRCVSRPRDDVSQSTPIHHHHHQQPGHQPARGDPGAAPRPPLARHQPRGRDGDRGDRGACRPTAPALGARGGWVCIWLVVMRLVGRSWWGRWTDGLVLPYLIGGRVDPERLPRGAGRRARHAPRRLARG